MYAIQASPSLKCSTRWSLPRLALAPNPLNWPGSVLLAPPLARVSCAPRSRSITSASFISEPSARTYCSRSSIGNTLAAQASAPALATSTASCAWLRYPYPSLPMAPPAALKRWRICSMVSSQALAPACASLLPVDPSAFLNTSRTTSAVICGLSMSSTRMARLRMAPVPSRVSAAVISASRFDTASLRTASM